MTKSGFDIDELERLLAAATGSGVWSLRRAMDKTFRVRTEAGTFVASGTYEQDAALIVAARNSLPAMIAEIRELRAENARLGRAFKDMVEEYKTMRSERVIEREAATEASHAAELLEQAERFSEAVDAYSKLWSKRTPSRDEYNTHFAPFTIAKPDPLVEAIEACDYATLDEIEQEFAQSLRAALAARGYEVRKIGADQ